MCWRRMVALAVPLAVLIFAMGFIVGLEARREPDWQLELEEYVAEHRAPSETVTVEKVVKAHKPWHFTAAMGTPRAGDWIKPASHPEVVRCVLLRRSFPSDDGTAVEEVRQVVFLVHHSDALYRVGWLAYAGPQEPFGSDLRAHLALIGCDLAVR